MDGTFSSSCAGSSSWSRSFSQVFSLLVGHWMPFDCDQRIGLFGPHAGLGHSAERINVVSVEPVESAG